MNSKRLQQNLKILQLADERKEELDQLNPLLKMIAESNEGDWAIHFTDKDVWIQNNGQYVTVKWNEYWQDAIYDTITTEFPLDWLDMNTVPVEHAKFHSVRDADNKKANESYEKSQRVEFERLKKIYG